MELSIPNSCTFLDSFELLQSIKLDEHAKNELNLFMLRINANEFNYNLLVENLMEPIITYSVSRKVHNDYANKPHALTKKAVSKFVEYYKNTGELGELLLYAFLECHLGAPKILTKLELKTSTNLYVNGADGVHFLKLPNGNYQLIFGESKTYSELGDAISATFTSIYEFKNGINGNGNKKSGINYEKSLISDNILKESFSEDDISFITDLIYPKKENKFYVDDAFGIFIGYQMNITDKEKMLPNDQFAVKIKNKIIKKINKKIEEIKDQIINNNLTGHSFHIYILPFTNLDYSREYIMEGLTTWIFLIL